MGSETQTKIQHVGGMVVDLGMAAPLHSHGLQLQAQGGLQTFCQEDILSDVF